MAQLKDSKIDGNLEVVGDIFMQTNKSIHGIHPTTGEASDMLHISEKGNTIVGYDGYINQNGNSIIYGNDIGHYVASAGNSSYRPYYRAGDVIDIRILTAGYVTNSGKTIAFTVPITKPVIGAPNAIATSNNGFILRQNNKYTHGSDADTFVKPTSYTVESNYNCGFIVKANFDVATDVTNNDAIGIHWNGTITLS